MLVFLCVLYMYGRYTLYLLYILSISIYFIKKKKKYFFDKNPVVATTPPSEQYFVAHNALMSERMDGDNSENGESLPGTSHMLVGWRRLEN